MEMRVRTEEGSRVRTHSEIIRRTASRAPEFIDITEEVEGVLGRSRIREGSVLVFSRHTTAAIEINEDEPLLLRDMAYFLERIAPREADYKHNDFVIRTANMTEDECPNGHAHCQHLMLRTSETIPVVEGRLLLGRWQRIFLIELDRPREREIIVQVQGW
ncbi:TPA: secondary thiamine-phosphate synthase enzyme [Candidatus Acetothermia bacterium]|mgnify:CR=1 FL=1|nr:secondary thiamine-phosphate synthase enzyme [Candidatus Acetothermia bacterium]